MLEKQLSILLATYLNQFICDLNEEQLRVSLWSGDLVLRDLRLRPNIVDQIALSLFCGGGGNSCDNNNNNNNNGGDDIARATARALAVPLTIVRGVVKELVITVPWSAIDGEPITVEARGVDIVFGPLRSRTYDADDDAGRVFVVKQKQLKLFELQRVCYMQESVEHGVIGYSKKSSFEGERKKTQLSYLDRLTETIKRNIYLMFSDVSLRYIVNYYGLAPCLTCALVLSVNSVYITTTDEEWEDRFVMDLSMPYCKKVLAKGLQLSLYAVKDSKTTENLDQNDASFGWQKTMNILEMEELRLHFCFSSGDDFAPSEQKKRVSVSVMTNGTVKFRLSFGALGTLALILDAVKDGLVGVNYRRHLHIIADNGEGTATLARRRWKFAIVCVLDDVGKIKNKGVKGDHGLMDDVLLFCRRRREYCALWKRSLGVQWLPPLTVKEKNALVALEEVLTLEQIVFLRCLTYTELSEERKRMLQQKVFIEDAIKRQKGSLNSNDLSKGGRFWSWWLFGRQHAASNTGGGSSSDTSDLDRSKAHIYNESNFDVEWAFGYHFLQTIAASDLNFSVTQSLSSSERKINDDAPTVTSSSSSPVVNIALMFSQVDVKFFPYVWRNDVMAKNVFLSYIENLQQYIVAHLYGVKCTCVVDFSSGDNPIGFGFSIKSATANFAGSLPCPLLSTWEAQEAEEEWGGKVGDDSFKDEGKQWLSIDVDKKNSTVSGSFLTTCVTVYSFCEFWWWISAIESFIDSIPVYRQRVVLLCNEPKSGNQITFLLPLLDIKVDKLLIFLPLISTYVEQNELSLIVPNIHLMLTNNDSMETDHPNTQKPPSDLRCSFLLSAASETEPVRLFCEGVMIDLLVLSFVKINAMFDGQWDIFVNTRAEVTIDQIALSLISEHVKNLFFSIRDNWNTVSRLVDENNGSWHLESHETLFIGDVLMTFPATQCRAFLIALHQAASEKREIEIKKREKEKTSTAVFEEFTPSPIRKITLNIGYMRAVVYNTNHEMIAEVEFLGVITENYDDTMLLPHSFLRDAFTLELTTFSQTSGYTTVICLPDIHIIAPSGQHVFVLDDWRITFTDKRLAALLVQAGEIKVVFCQSLVNFLEVLIMSFLLFQPPAAGVVPQRCGYQEGTFETLTLLNNASEVAFSVNAMLKKMVFSFQLEPINDNIVFCFNDLLFGAEKNNSGRHVLRLKGFFDYVNYIAEDVEEVKSFALIAPSCGIVSDVKPITFDCFFEHVIDANDVNQRKILLNTTGGRVGLFYAYWLRVASLKESPTIVSLFRLFEYLGRRRNSVVVPSPAFSHSAVSSVETRRQSTTMEEMKENLSLKTVIIVEIKDLELLLATNACKEIDVLNDATYIYFIAQKITCLVDMSHCVSDNSVGDLRPFVAEVKLHKLCNFCPSVFTGELLACISYALLRVENYARLFENSEKSAYEYIKGGVNDVAAHLAIDPAYGDNAEEGATLPASIDIKLSLPLLQNFIMALYFNLLNISPLVDLTQCVERVERCNESESLEEKVTRKSMLEESFFTKASQLSLSSTSFFVTVSSARVVFINDQDIFVIRAALQLYSFSGEERTGLPFSKKMLHVKALTVDDISPSWRVVHRDAPRSQQQHFSSAPRKSNINEKKRMLEIESGFVCSLQCLTHSTEVPTTTTEVLLDGANMSTAHCSWTALFYMFISADSFELFRAIREDLSNVKKPPSRAESHVFFLTLRGCTVCVEEPWGEPLAQLQLRSITARRHQCASQSILQIALDEPLFLTPCLNTETTQASSVIQWDDFRKDVSLPENPTYLQITITSVAEDGKSYQFDTPYAEMPGIFYCSRIKMTLNYAQVFVETNFFRRLAHFALNEAAVYSSLLKTIKKVDYKQPISSVPLVEINIKNVCMHLPEIDLAAKSWWRLELRHIYVRNETLKVSLANNVLGKTMALYCFSNLYTVNLSGAVFSFDQRLCPLFLPDTMLRLQFPILESTFTEVQSTVTVTQDDRANVQSTYTFFSSKALTNVFEITPEFFWSVHIRTSENSRFVISAFHIQDALRMLSFVSTVAEVPLYYTGSAEEEKEMSVCMTLSITVELPKISFCLTEAGQMPVGVTNNKDEQKQERDEEVLRRVDKEKTKKKAFGEGVILAELCFFDVVTFAASFNAHNPIFTRAHFFVKGAFELFYGSGTPVLYRSDTATSATAAVVAPENLCFFDVTTRNMQTGFYFELADTLQERQLTLHLEGITIFLHPRTVDFVFFMQNLIFFMHHKETFKKEYNTGNIVASNVDSIELTQHVNVESKKQTKLSVFVGEILFLMEHTAQIEARNISASLNWDDVRQTSTENVSTPYSFVVGELLLRQLGSGLAFVSVSSLELLFDVGLVNIRTKSCVINNYEMMFYIEICNWAKTLHDYIMRNIPFSKKQNDGFKQSVIVNLMDVRVCVFFLWQPHLSGKPSGSIEIMFPVIILKKTASTTRESFSFETEKGVIRYSPPRCALVVPFIKNVSFTCFIEKNFVARSQSTVMHLGSIEAFMPLGDTLQCCVEAVAQVFLPLLSFPFPFTTNRNDAYDDEDVYSYDNNNNNNNNNKDDNNTNNNNAINININGIDEDVGRHCSTFDMPSASFNNEKLVFTVPLVTLNVCASQSDEGTLLERPAILFGLSLHNVLYEQSRRGWNEKTLFEVSGVSSTVDNTIQQEFVSAMAPSGALDEPSKRALYFCKEIFSKRNKGNSDLSFEDNENVTDKANNNIESCGNNRDFGFCFDSNANNNNSNDCERTSDNDETMLEQLPPRFVSVLARAHAVKITLSPSLLSTLNEHVLLHVASGLHRIKEQTLKWTPHFAATNFYHSGSLSHSDHYKRVITVTGDFCLKADLRLGGRRGVCLRFLKAPIEANPTNKLTLRGINHAKIFLSMHPASDNTLKPPIVVDPGLTIVTEDVTFVIKRGKLTDYVELGERSFFLVSSKSILSASLTDLSDALHNNVNATLNKTTADFNTVVPLIFLRWYNIKVSFDIFTDITLCLWSRQQSIAVTGEACARYKLDKNCFEGNRGVRDFIDECGVMALSNMSILCDSGVITKEPTGLMVYVKHHKLSEDHTNAGMTVIQAILSNTSITLSLGNMRLLCDILNQLRQGVDHIGSTMYVTTVFESSHKSHKSCYFPSSRPSYFYPSNTDYSLAVEPSVLWSRDGEVIPLVEFTASAPQVELTLTNNFYKPEVVVEVSSTALLARGNRSFSRMTWSASTTIRITDYPQYQPERDVLLVSPEVTAEYTRYKRGGFSFQGALICHEMSVTVPLVTALRLLRFSSLLQRTGTYSIRNNTGISLLLLFVTKEGENIKGEKEAGITQFCRLPPEQLVKVAMFNSNQTRFCIVSDFDGSDNAKHSGSVSTLGAEVDLSAMQRGTTYRFSLAEHLTGVLDVVMRLNEAKRLVEITSSVEIKNELAEHAICFFEPFNGEDSGSGGDDSSFLLVPGETRYATFPTLCRPFFLQIGEWQTTIGNGLFTLELLINAFTLLPDERKSFLTSLAHRSSFAFLGRTYLEDDNTLVLPLTLTKLQYKKGNAAISGKDEEENETNKKELSVLMVLTRKVALESTPRTLGFLPHYEVELRICPLVTIFNETGMALAIRMNTSCTRNEPLDEPTFLRDGDVFNCFSRHCEGETPMVSLMCELANGVRLSSVEPFSLFFTGTVKVFMRDVDNSLSCPFSDEKDALLLGAFLVERVTYGKFVVFVAAILVNTLPFPVRVYNHLNALLIGQESNVGLEPGHKLPVMFLAHAQEQRQRNSQRQPHHHYHPSEHDTGIMVKVSAGSDSAKLSQQFACNALNLSCMLHTEDKDVVRIFRAHRLGGNDVTGSDLCAKKVGKLFASTPVVRLEAMWIFRNQSHMFPLRVRCVGLEDVVVTIEPKSSRRWDTFASSSAANPLIQVRYGGENDDGFFMWCEPVELVSLSGSNEPITIKQHIFESLTDGEQSSLPASLLKKGVTMFSSMRVPMMVGEEPTCERFAFLSIRPWKQNNLFFVDFSLNKNIPIVVENRTKWLLQYEQVQKPLFLLRQVTLAYSVGAFSDGVACFEGCNVPHVMRFMLLKETYKDSVSCVVDLKKSAAARETVRVANDMFVLCTYDYNLQQYHVSVTTDYSLESTLLFQPGYIIHVETFIRSLSLHIASICVPKSETSLENTPLAALVARNELILGDAINVEGSTNAELLSILKCRELDLVLFQAFGIYGALSVNEKQYFGRVDIDQLALIDCTSPAPFYPVVLELKTEKVDSAVSNSKSIKSYFLVASRLFGCDKNLSEKNGGVLQKVFTIPFHHLLIDVSPVTVKLADSLLFLLRQASVCLLETLAQTRVTPDWIGNIEDEEDGVDDKSVNATLHNSINEAFVYNFYIANLHVSRIDLSLTVTRRSDGKFNPFEGLNFGGRFIPSVERAPLSISEVKRRDVNQRGSSFPFALLAVLWPSYRTQLTLQLYKIVGSMNALGNPIALISGWRKGVHSLVTEAVDMNPMKGAREFFFATASSTLHSVCLLSRVGSQTAATISLDSGWLESRDEEGRSREDSSQSGILHGAAQGLLYGIGGVVSRPLNGARTAGFTGFCTGVATGAVGLFTRPVAGVLDGFGNTAEFYSRQLQEPDQIPNAHINYVNSKRNFNASVAATIDENENSLLAPSVRNSPKQNVISKDFLPGLGRCLRPGSGVCEFVLEATFDLLRQNAKNSKLNDKEEARFLINAAGAHNYALYANWDSFVAYTTPEEFYNWVHVALAAVFAKEITKLLSFQNLSENSLPLSSSLLPLNEFLRDSSTVGYQADEAEKIENIAALERAKLLKKTLGTRDMLKYVSPENFARVCSLNEIRQHVSPKILHEKLSYVLLLGVVESFEALIQADVGDR